MLTDYCVVIFGVLSLSGALIEQKTLTFVDGYRSSCKYHLQGNVNLILSAPHGGSLVPDDLPDRISGGCRRRTGPNAGSCTWLYDDSCDDGETCSATTVKDTLSDEFTENVAQELINTWGLTPYVIIGTWSRKKVDFNREINEATFNHPESMIGYQNYHTNIQQGINEIQRKFSQGLLIDIHGHSAGNYSMLGYLLTGSQLNTNNLSDPSFSTSIESLCSINRNECIRGSKSFGSYMEIHGLGIVYPSLANPKPGSNKFFSGGYITSNYISQINAIQTELPYSLRVGGDRLTYAKNYAKALLEYMQANDLLLHST